LIEFLADPPSEKEMKAALSTLAFETRGEMRIEQFINSLYLTECIQCGEEIPAEAFIWEREAEFPSQKIFHCPHCLEKGTYPTTEGDINRTIQFGRVELHIARASERIAALDDPDRVFVEEALSIYLPRTIYAILTLINRYDNIPEIHRKPLAALLLAAFDQATVLWPFPHEKYRPKKLAPLSSFRENNIWFSLENVLVDWSNGLQSFPYKKSKIPTSIWPERLQGEGNICIFTGRFKEFAQVLQSSSFDLPIKSVVTAIPRPNQAFWSLSVIWAGMLWGRETASRIKGVLRRKRFDWTWYCSALGNTFSSITKIIKTDTNVLGVISEPESSFLGTVLSSAWLNNLSLENVAPRLGSNEIQIHWVNKSDNQKHKIKVADNIGANFQNQLKSSIKYYLSFVKEPSHFISLYSYGFFSFFQKFTPDFSRFNLSNSDFYNLANNTVIDELSKKNMYTSSGRSEHSLENARFWLANKNDLKNLIQPDSLTLLDRTEIEVNKTIVDQIEMTFQHIDHRICLALPGLLTPEIETIYECLKSYAREIDSKNIWRIRTQDLIGNRIQDIFQMQEILVELGSKLNFEVKTNKYSPRDHSNSLLPQQPVVVDWKDFMGENLFRFHIISTAIFANIIMADTNLGDESTSINNARLRKIIILPGGRSNLIRYKIQRDFRFRDLSERNWIFLKFRHLRRLYEDKSLTLEKFIQNLSLDPLANTDPQITFL
jgi:hypothetical protein